VVFGVCDGGLGGSEFGFYGVDVVLARIRDAEKTRWVGDQFHHLVPEFLFGDVVPCDTSFRFEVAEDGMSPPPRESELRGQVRSKMEILERGEYPMPANSFFWWANPLFD